MGRNELEFSVFLINRLAKSWGKSTPETYRVLSDTKILDDYIVECYDSLHTLGSEYLIDDITAFAKERGALI
jgi:hypothetical protein